MTKNIGVFGGSFDPLTAGHSLAITEILNYNDTMIQSRFFELIYVIPCGDNRRDKSNRLSAEDRLDLTTIGLQNLIELGVVRILPIEIQNKTFMPAADIHKYLQEQNRGKYNIWWVIGEDILPNLHTWIDSEYVLREIPFFVLPRENAYYAGPMPTTYIRVLPEKMVTMNVSSSIVRERCREFWTRVQKGHENELFVRLAGIIILVQIVLNGLVPKPVIECIIREKLYSPH